MRRSIRLFLGLGDRLCCWLSYRFGDRFGCRFSDRLCYRFGDRLCNWFSYRLGDRFGCRLCYRLGDRFSYRLGDRFGDRLCNRFGDRLCYRFGNRLCNWFSYRLCNRLDYRLSRRFCYWLGYRLSGRLARRLYGRRNRRHRLLGWLHRFFWSNLRRIIRFKFKFRFSHGSRLGLDFLRRFLLLLDLEFRRRGYDVRIVQELHGLFDNCGRLFGDGASAGSGIRLRLFRSLSAIGMVGVEQFLDFGKVEFCALRLRRDTQTRGGNRRADCYQVYEFSHGSGSSP